MRVEESAPGVLSLWLDRPERRNAIDGPTIEALLAVFERVEHPVVVLGSTDANCFCAGADLSIPDDERAEVSDQLYELYQRMTSTTAVIIAACPGYAVGGGAQLAIASDLRIGSATTKFRFPGIGHGLAVGAWGLPSLVGRGRALELCLTMRTVGAEPALAMGLLDQIADDAPGRATALATAIAAQDRDAVRRVKRIVNDGTGLAAALADERAANRAQWSGSVAGLETGSGKSDAT